MARRSSPKRKVKVAPSEPGLSVGTWSPQDTTAAVTLRKALHSQASVFGRFGCVHDSVIRKLKPMSYRNARRYLKELWFTKSEQDAMLQLSHGEKTTDDQETLCQKIAEKLKVI